MYKEESTNTTCNQFVMKSFAVSLRASEYAAHFRSILADLELRNEKIA